MGTCDMRMMRRGGCICLSSNVSGQGHSAGAETFHVTRRGMSPRLTRVKPRDLIVRESFITARKPKFFLTQI
jgi:hypothetical protein